METTLAKARTFFGRFQRWYVRHQLSKASGTTGPDLADYKRRLFADPLGLVPVDHTDTRCWTTKKISGKTTHLETEFYRGLKLYQEENYLYYRASIPLYIDADCKTKLEVWITRQEQNHTPPLNKDNRLDKDVRLTWRSIKGYLLVLSVLTHPGQPLLLTPLHHHPG